jgi:hypothetical protein
MAELTATERQEHLSLMAWIRTQPRIAPYWIHIANEGKRNVVQGYHLKRMGLRAGVSDFFLAYPCGQYAGLWLELKRKCGGFVTLQQREWLALMKGIGYAAYVGYGWEHATEVIKSYLDDRMDF